MRTASEDTELRPQRADARRNRERIVEAAREVFATSGAVAHIDEIARRAGVGVGTVYRHFPNKDALVGALILHKFEEIAERIERWLARDDVSPWEAFEGCMRESAQKMATDASQQRMIWDAEDEAFEIAAPALQRTETLATEMIRRAQEAGDLRADFRQADIGTFMCALGGGMSARMRTREMAWERLVDFWLDGLRA